MTADDIEIKNRKENSMFLSMAFSTQLQFSLNKRTKIKHREVNFRIHSTNFWVYEPSIYLNDLVTSSAVK